MKKKSNVVLIVGLIIISFVLGYIISPKHSDSEQATTIASTAWNNFYSENYDQAITDFNQAIAENSDDYNSLMGLGWVHYYNGDYDKAAAAFETVIQRSSGSPAAHDALGWTHFKKGNLDAAKEQFDISFSLDSRNSNVYDSLGFYHYYTQDYENAVAMFEKSVEYDPASLRYGYANYAYLGWAQYHTQDYEAAMSSFERMLIFSHDAVYREALSLIGLAAVYFEIDQPEMVEEIAPRLKELMQQDSGLMREHDRIVEFRSCMNSQEYTPENIHTCAKDL